MLAHLARMRGPLHYTRKFQKAGATKLILDKPALLILADDGPTQRASTDEVSAILVPWLTRAVASR
jgi:hypothetical protein